MSDGHERESLLLPILIPVGALSVIGVVLYAFSRVLLAVKPNAATAIALVAAVGIMAVAVFVASRKQVTGAALGAFVGAAAGISMLAAGIAIAVIGPPEEEVEPFHVTLAAPEGAAADGFSTDALSVKPEVPIDLEFDNQDPRVGHNVQIFDGPDDAAPVLFDGAIITGPAKTTYAVEPLSEGDYFFNCRIHPTTMTGTITAAEGAGGLTVVAENTEFATDELELPAETPTLLTFDNLDPAPHNLSIYEDDTASGEPLFTFEPFPGPEAQPFEIPAIPQGEYYFRCDVHPTMEGTVIVEPAPPPGEEGAAPPGEGNESPSAPPDEGG
ncbi:MAG TPA: cupredoxin domain-containing protein [Actinomycetota bacterium]|nr:cupredoxin domain-containing protein [Actinomycetota bacterium]